MTGQPGNFGPPGSTGFTGPQGPIGQTGKLLSTCFTNLVPYVNFCILHFVKMLAFLVANNCNNLSLILQLVAL